MTGIISKKAVTILKRDLGWAGGELSRGVGGGVCGETGKDSFKRGRVQLNLITWGEIKFGIDLRKNGQWSIYNDRISEAFEFLFQVFLMRSVPLR